MKTLTEHNEGKGITIEI